MNANNSTLRPDSGSLTTQTTNPSNSINPKYLLLSLLFTGLIIFVSSIPDTTLWGDDSLIKQIISNLAHIPEYGVLTFLWLMTFTKEDRTKLLSMNLFIATVILVFAVSDEIHQSFVPGRTASLMDICLDCFGILCGLIVYRNLRKKRSLDGVRSAVHP